MRPPIIFIDVDDTLVRNSGDQQVPMRSMIEKVRSLARSGAILYCWSSGGAEYAKRTARKLGLDHCFSDFLPKPHIMIDDQPVSEWWNLSELLPSQATDLSFSEFEDLAFRSHSGQKEMLNRGISVSRRLKLFLDRHIDDDLPSERNYLEMIWSFRDWILKNERAAKSTSRAFGARREAFSLLESILKGGGDLAMIVRLEVLGALCDQPSLARSAFPCLGPLSREYVRDVLPTLS